MLQEEMKKQTVLLKIGVLVEVNEEEMDKDFGELNKLEEYGDDQKNRSSLFLVYDKRVIMDVYRFCFIRRD